MGTALLQLVNNLGPVHFWGLLLAAIVLTVTGFHSAFAHLSRARILEDIPTSMVRSASQGYIELQGTSRTLDGPKIFSPLSHT
ncbi:MAG: hypothetical protein KJO55_08810, partial [Gammaproteobacteria bacterium]|nr:hypothetical protein [Gammaproteobacteria bacterium]